MAAQTTNVPNAKSWKHDLLVAAMIVGFLALTAGAAQFSEATGHVWRTVEIIK